MKGSGILIYKDNKQSRVPVTIYVKESSSGSGYSGPIIIHKTKNNQKLICRLYNIQAGDNKNFKAVITSNTNKYYKRIATLHLDNELESSDDPSKLPHGVTHVQYLRNQSMATIDTGLFMTEDIEIEIKCKLNRITSSVQTICGSVSADGYFNLVLSCQKNADGKFFTQIGRTGQYVLGSTTDLDVHIFKITVSNGFQTIQMDNGTVYSADSTYFVPSRSLYLFDRNSPFSYNTAYCDIYYFKVRKNGELIADFIPIRKSQKDTEDVGGMYDYVTKQLFYSIRAFGFSWGPDVTE